MQEYIHRIDKTGKEFAHPLPESWKELVELAGAKTAFAHAIHGYRIACNAVDRNEGKEGKRARMTKAMEILRANPEKAKELGIDLSLLE